MNYSERNELKKKLKNIIKTELNQKPLFVMGSDTTWKLGARVSPENEESIVKMIPAVLADKFLNDLKQLYPTVKFKLRYRGPRSGFSRGYCLKENARSVAIYLNY